MSRRRNEEGLEHAIKIAQATLSIAMLPFRLTIHSNTLGCALSLTTRMSKRPRIDESVCVFARLCLCFS